MGSEMCIRDSTQTGLRAFPSIFFDVLCNTEGEKYEYEFNVLLQLAKISHIESTPITTLYFDRNRKSQFRPILDSILVYAIFLRFFSTVLLVSLLDMLLIYFAIMFFPNSYSFLFVRIFTVHLYFFSVRSKVFKVKNNLAKQLILFYPYTLLNMVISWQIFNKLFFELENSFITGYLAGIIIMFFINFMVQKNIIFTKY